MTKNTAHDVRHAKIWCLAFFMSVFIGSCSVAYAYSGETPIKGLLSKAYAATQRARIDAKRAAVSEGERHSGKKLPGQIAEHCAALPPGVVS